MEGDEDSRGLWPLYWFRGSVSTPVRDHGRLWKVDSYHGVISRRSKNANAIGCRFAVVSCATWIENHWCHISLSVHVFARWMRGHMRGMDLRNMPQPRQSIVLIEIWVAVLGGTFYYVDNMSWWRVTMIGGGGGDWKLVSGVSFHASGSSWKVMESRFISWRDISKIKECERN